MNHKFMEAWDKSTLGRLCENDIVGIVIIFTLAMSMWFIELKFIYMTFFAYCYVKDFHVMMTQVR